MMILALDSSGAVASAALVNNRTVIAEYSLLHNKTHSVMLLPMINDILERAGVDISEVDGIAVSEGPGSFTGLRIGGTMAKSFAFAADKPLLNVSTLEALAFNVSEFSGLIVPVIDARRSQVYTAAFFSDESGFHTVRAQTACDIHEITGFVAEWLGKNNMPSAMFVGDGTESMREEIEKDLGGRARFASPQNNRQRASSVALLGERYLMQGRIADTDSFAPVYLRSSQAERVREEKGIQ